MTPAHDRTEKEQERLNRQMSEVLQEVRIAMPGVQLLFAFLLTVPFADGFEDVNGVQRDLFLVALVAAGVSSALFIAPAAYHRILFERGNKPRIIQFATRCAVGGLVALAISMLASVFLVTSVIFDDATAAVVTGVLATVFAWLWFGAAWVRRAR